MLKSLPISRKIALAFGAIILAALAMGSVVFINAQHVHQLTVRNDLADREQLLVTNMENSILLQTIHLRGYLLTGQPAYAEAFEQARVNFDRRADELVPLLTDPGELAEAREAILTIRTWNRERGMPLLARARTGDLAGARELFNTQNSPQRAAALITALEGLRNAKIDQVHQTLARMDSASGTERTALVIGLTAMLILTVALWWVLSTLLARPLVAMNATMRRLAQGDNAVDVPSADRGDELGDMAKAVLVFRDAAIAKEAMEAERERARRDQQRVVQEIETALARMRDGDLGGDIRVEFPEAYQGLKSNFNETLARLRELIGAVLSSTLGIRTGSGEIAHASEDLAKRTEANAASLEETSAALTQFDEHLKVTARSADQTARRAEEATGIVSSGRTVADRAVQAMGRVSESATGIDDVIEGLDKIAFQTRVLAMNAAVEAGRAGEAGRGFAVVADLVSALAMRAEDEAKRARDQLSITQVEIGAAVEAVQQVDHALSGIASGVAEVQQLVGGMAADSHSQATAIGQISAALTTMDQATQQNAAMVEQTSAAVRTLTGEVNILSDQATQFRVDGGASSAPPAIARQPGALVH